MSAPLIAAPELIAALARQDQDWLLIDCRFNLGNPAAGELAYALAHAAGALYAHLDRDLSGAKTGRNGRHPLPTTETFVQTVRTWGITPGTRVVAYDDAGGMFAARLWWLLRFHGFDQIQVLDGGWQAWLAAQGPVDTASPARQPSAFKAQTRQDWLTDVEHVLAHLNQPGQQALIDARAADRFRGENETMDAVGGHIPGARNRFFQLNLQANGQFKPADQLRDEFQALLGQTPMTAVVHQCGSGVTACHNLLAMAHAGLPATRLYAGSWSEWCSDASRPVER
ncbi:MAG: sulfurtransferase [Aquabacterium sp.]|uniref:sulfurtransferase n=1 Tax=Aquabacterium sp. TaxID=1872578 RepID=UPI0011FF2D4E|nr:sulfurtransferase [Aquabacterium sp.]TAK90786.1 MAG: sulfurtransferase [Aquabacterium sp.]